MQIGAVDHRQGQRRTAKRIVAHPGWRTQARAGQNPNDIALVELYSPVQANYARLAGRPAVNSVVKPCGWGRKSLRQLKCAEQKVVRYLDNGVLAAARVTGNITPGDSGGPMFLDGRQVAVNLGERHSIPILTFHLPVANHHAWIQRVIKK